MGADSQGGYAVATYVEQHTQRSMELTLDELDQGHWFVVTPQGRDRDRRQSGGSSGPSVGHPSDQVRIEIDQVEAGLGGDLPLSSTWCWHSSPDRRRLPFAPAGDAIG